MSPPTRPEDPAAQARRLEAAGLPGYALSPLWHRGFRALGVALAPPLVLSYRQHLLYGGTWIGGFLLSGAALLWSLGSLSPLTGLAMALLTWLLPTLGWLRCRRLRRRLERDVATVREPPHAPS